MATSDERFITVPARAREEIGELAFYLEQTLRNLREVNEHVRGSSETMPGVLHELRDIVQMTESATVRVLDETEALVEDSKAAMVLLAQAEDVAADGVGERVAEPLAKVKSLVQRNNDRAVDIMSALEFQDLTSQKVHRAFAVLEEVCGRLTKIRGLVDVGHEEPAAASPAPAPDAASSDGKSAQELADELLLGFEH